MQVEGDKVSTEIEILGHKAKIERVSSQVRGGIYWKEDHLVVWLAFDEAVEGILSFPVLLPVKRYVREEFLYNVRQRGEEELQRILARDAKERRERRERHEREAAIDAIAAEVQELID